LDNQLRLLYANPLNVDTLYIVAYYTYDYQ
jgi:hypothetical protein